MDARKTYRALLRLGAESDTYDRTGAVVERTGAPAMSRSDFEEALRRFEGEVMQAPPPFSAIKQGGVPLYKLARAGKAVETAPRPVHIYRIELVTWEPPFAGLEVECGKGTYVRSLAHDLGAALGTGALLQELTRTRVGPFAIERAVTIDQLRAEFETGAWQERLLCADEVLLDWPAAILGAESERRLRNGMAAQVTELRSGPRQARVYTAAGDFLGVVRREAPGRWRPAKLL
jgi:tRNA pseudouridine55 synthase